MNKHTDGPWTFDPNSNNVWATEPTGEWQVNRSRAEVVGGAGILNQAGARTGIGAGYLGSHSQRERRCVMEICAVKRLFVKPCGISKRCYE